MTADLDRGRTAVRQVYFHDPAAPVPTVVAPSVFVVARSPGGRLLMVRRCDSGEWELPGGRVEVGETAVDAAVRETAEEAGVHVLVTGLVGLFTDPAHVVRAPDGAVRQQFVVLFRARAVGGSPHGDMHETSEAAWVALRDLGSLPIRPPVRAWIDESLANESVPHIG